MSTVSGKRRDPVGADASLTGLQVAEKAMDDVCTSQLMLQALIEARGALHPSLNTTVEASKFMERHAAEIFSRDAPPSLVPNERLAAVRKEAQSVLALLEHMNRTATALESKLVQLATAAEEATEEG